MTDRTGLDPQLEAVATEWEQAGIPEWHRLSVRRARRLEDELFSPEDPPDVDLVRDLAFEAPRDDGGPPPGEPAREVPVRVYRDADPPAPTVVFFHGGGWTLGTLDSADDVARALARRGDAAVVSVAYRLAPEHPFPAAVADAAAALSWVADVAPSLGGDPDQLAVAGTSAGGNLAAAAALWSREFDGPAVDHQVLLYPMLDDDFGRDSYREAADGPFLTRADVRWFWTNYCRHPVDRHNPFAAPLREPDPSGLPPATVVTAGHDPLRDEGIAYADRLTDAGVAVDHRHYPAMAHGFLSMADDVDGADAALDRVAEAVGSPPD
ncbi:MAG: alpha/beta hydrolase [Halobacteriales archaeon]